MLADYVFFTTAFLISAMTPGADTLLVATRGVQSRSSGYSVGLGIALAKVLMVGALYFSLDSLISQTPAIMVILKIFGASFLFWKSFSLWNNNPNETRARTGDSKKDLLLGFAVGLSNPQPFGFYLAVLPTVVTSTEFAALGVIAFVGFLAVTGIYVEVGKSISSIVTGPRNRLLFKSVAVLIACLGLWVLFRQA